MVTNKLNIVVIGVFFPFRGGIALYSTRLCHELMHSHKVTCINFKRLYPGFLFPGKTQYDTSNVSLSIENERLIDSLWPISWAKTGLHINKLEPDMVIFEWWHPFFGPAYEFICRMMKKKAVVLFQCHNVEPHEQSIVDRFLAKRTLKCADVAIVHSKKDMSKLKSLLPNLRVFQHHHPVYDIYPVQTVDIQEKRKILSIDSQKKIILFFGFIRKYKGLRILLEAISLFDEETSPILLVVGEFYEPEQPYRQLVSDLKIQDRVVFIPDYVPNEDVSSYFQISEAVVLPYLDASQSGIIQVARFFLCPIIATNVGGLPDLIDSPRNGIIVEPNNAHALKNAIEQILDTDTSGRIKLEMEKEQEKYSWKNMVLKIEQIYDEMNSY